jgi:two-component system, cell cycle sensor histidine kinase and response regulator CckA
MTGFGMLSFISAYLPLTVPSYALRLVRRFGAQNVGWFLVSAFAALGALYLLKPSGDLGGGAAADLTSTAAVALLLLGMGHLEGICAERQRSERETRARNRRAADLEAEAADLLEANRRLSAALAQRETAARALEASVRHYRGLFLESPVPMWIFDRASGGFLAANPAALRQYGFSREEFLALNARDLLPAETAEAFLRHVVQGPACSPEPSRWRHLRNDLTLMDVEVTAADIEYGGQPARLVLAQDVSRRLSHDRAWLEAQKTLILRQVAAGIAHHFNNILAVVEGHATLLLAERGAAPPEAALIEISRAAHRAAAITRQLLTASGQQFLQRELVEINGLLHKLSPTLCRLAGQRILFHHTSLASDLPLILADPRLLEQIVVALVLNARQAMPQGGHLTLTTSRVHLEPHDTSGPGAFVCLAVRDSGCGMSREVQAHLFEPFFTTRDVGQGLGLGLASVKGAAQQHGGRVEVVSEPGAGTEVRVLFPCA